MIVPAEMDDGAGPELHPPLGDHPHRGTSLGAAIALMLVAAGCGGHRILEDGCALVDEERVAELLGPAPHDVVLVGEPEPTHLAWSERAGLFVAPLPGGDGTARRLGSSCEGGLSSSGGLIACSRRGDDAKADPGHVAVYGPDDSAPRWRAEGVGPDGSGVGLAIDGQSMVLVWNAARDTAGSVWRQRTGGEAVRLSRNGVRAGRPDALWERTPEGAPRLVVAWPETWADRNGRVEGALFVQTGERSPAELEPLAYDASHPSLRAGPHGEALLSFRDRRPAGSRPRVFVRRVGRRDRALDGVHANADGESIAVPCAGAVVLVSPRTHSRAERLVAVRRHDAETLEGSGPEHQIYEHGAAFEHADARCVGDDVLVAIASHATIERPRGAVSTVRFHCPAPGSDD